MSIGALTPTAMLCAPSGFVTRTLHIPSGNS
jgi:hypothetical protein